MNQLRRPKGTPAGGQFASGSKGESASRLDGTSDPNEAFGVRFANGNPSFAVKGMNPKDSKELRDRLHAAFVNAGIPWPLGEINVRRDGNAPLSEVAVAAGLMEASGQMPTGSCRGVDCFGRLRVDGSVQPLPEDAVYQVLRHRYDSGHPQPDVVYCAPGDSGVFEGHGTVTVINKLQELHRYMRVGYSVPPLPGEKIDEDRARALPSGSVVLVEFSTRPERKYRMMARDMPVVGSADRRFTNLDTGMEHFFGPSLPPSTIVSITGSPDRSDR